MYHTNAPKFSLEPGVKLKNGGEIGDMLKQYPIGNGTCNYRHPYAIYDTDIYQSKGFLVNSYGY